MNTDLISLTHNYPTKRRTNAAKINLLVIDDTPDNLELILKMLSQKGFEVRCATNGHLGLKIAKSGWAEIVLLDILMPNFNGYQVCQELKADPKTNQIPIIFLSSFDGIDEKKKAFKSGGADYISKPFNQQELLIRLENQIAILEAKNQLQILNQELEQRVKQRTEELEKANHKLTQEIKQRQLIQDKLLQIAVHDSLTGLPNRIWFSQRLNQLLEHNKQEAEKSFAILFLDCDRFKMINDSLGHFVGDRVLIEIANRLMSCLQPIDTVARFGGDEFAILLESVDNIDGAIEVAIKIQETLVSPFKYQQHKLFLSASIGIVLTNSYYQSSEHLLRDADTAMYSAKSGGKSCYRVFDESMHQNALAKLNLESDLRLAIKEQNFIVYYQPIINLKTDKISGFEALVRWIHPEKGIISPLNFIPLAEETGLIIPLGLWIMETACRQLYLWQQQYKFFDLKIGINLSVKQFAQTDLIEQIDLILQRTKLKSHNLYLEITESAIMDNPQSVTNILEQLKKRNIKLSIDDFGTGYSSLSYLHQFPVNTLKIDRSFVKIIDSKGNNLEIMKAITTLAHNLKMDIVAEGIETLEQKEYLQRLGCEFGQGYYFAKPLSRESVDDMLKNILKR